MHTLVCILVCVCVVGFTQLVSLQAETPVGEPYSQKAEDSSMVLLDNPEDIPSLAVSEEVLSEQTELEPLDLTEYEEPKESDAQDQSDQNRDNSGDNNNQDRQNSDTEEKEPGNDPTKKNPDEKGNGENGYNTPTETDLTYFKTSIKDGETVTEKSYSFTITHTEEVRKQELTPQLVEVLLNGEIVPQFNGSLLLEDGQNEIMVRVTYEKRDGSLKTVGKKYVVYLDRNGIVITDSIRSLENYGYTVYKEIFEFEAYAALGSEEVPLTVTVNGEEMKGSDHYYKTRLAVGSNQIKLSSSYPGYAETSITYDVMYDKDLFDHNLTDQEIHTSGFEFFADLKSGVELSPSGRYAVMLNGSAITNDSGKYEVELSPHVNTITLKVTDAPNAISYIQEFEIIYTPPEGENAPIITTSLDNSDLNFKSMRHLLSVEAYSYLGEQIVATGKNGSGLTVTLNGQTVYHASSNITYDLYFIQGENIVTVTARDEEGYYTTKEYSVYCEGVNVGEKIGTATISVEASTVGLGYLIPPTQVDIYEGENAVYPLGRLLDASGFQYNFSGTPDNGFYLAHLLKGGITNGAAIPKDLKAYLESAGIGLNGYEPNSLGENDFTVASGWVYQIDGAVPQYGLSECFLQDGQTLRLRYTLAQGRDVGCGGGNNFGNEW